MFDIFAFQIYIICFKTLFIEIFFFFLFFSFIDAMFRYQVNGHLIISLKNRGIFNDKI